MTRNKSMTKSRVAIREQKQKDKKGRIGTIIAIIALIVIGIAIYCVANFNHVQGNVANYVASKNISNQRKNKQKKKPSFNMKAVKPVSPSSLANAYQHRRDYRSVGQIAIRNENILLNIYRGVGNLELNLGAGTMNRDQKMGEGNYALAGHNMDDGRTFFSPLYTAKVRGYLTNGTTIFLTDYKKVYYYKITSSRFIGSYNLNLSWNNKKFKKKPVISLFTCDWTGRGRLFVRGEYTGSQSYKSASKYVRSSFNF